MNEIPEQPTARSGFAGSRTASSGGSGSVIEHQLVALVEGTPDSGGLPVDVVHPDVAAGS